MIVYTAPKLKGSLKRDLWLQVVHREGENVNQETRSVNMLQSVSDTSSQVNHDTECL